jgi:hypothetical protein
MPFDPYQVQGTLPDYDLKEFADTGILPTGCSYTPRVNIREKEGHLPGAEGASGGYGQILQVQVHKKALDMELSAEIVPDANGVAVGLANVYPGEAVTCAQFAAASGGGSALVIHGFSRNAARLLMVKEVKRETSNEKAPAVTVPLSYYPEIAIAG